MAVTPRQRQDQKNEAFRRWYSKPENKAKAVTAASERRKKHNNAVRSLLKKIIVGRVCKQCGFDNPLALQYHHRNEKTKLFNIADSAGVYRSEKKILEEVKKCDILCANCHFILHAMARGR